MAGRSSAAGDRATILVCGPPVSALGGGPTHVRNLLASPLAQRFRLVHVEVGSRGAESPARDEPLPATLWRLGTGPLALAARILGTRPAVVHINTALDPKAFWRDAANVLVCRMLGRKVVYQIHGGSLASVAGTRGAARGLAGWVLRHADAVVALAPSERAQFAGDFAVRRLEVIPNAVDVAAYRRPDAAPHAGGARRLAYLGRLVADKGIADAIEAVGLLRKSPGFEGVTLRIAGTGEASAELERQIAALGLAGAVTLVGPLLGDAKIEFLRSADLFVLPTRFSEGLPYTILESLAAGTPIVTTGMGGIADVVTDGEHGVFVRPREPRDIADAVRRLAGDPERVRRMSRACAARAEERYGLARFAQAFGALYESLGAGGAVAASFAPE